MLAGSSNNKSRPRTIARNVRIFAMRQREELVAHALNLLEREGSAAKVGANWPKLVKFVEQCSVLYHQNPYHNWHHAVDVTHTMAWMLTRPALREHIPPVDAFWLLIASIAHDLDHPGLERKPRVICRDRDLHDRVLPGSRTRVNGWPRIRTRTLDLEM